MYAIKTPACSARTKTGMNSKWWQCVHVCTCICLSECHTLCWRCSASLDSYRQRLLHKWKNCTNRLDGLQSRFCASSLFSNTMTNTINKQTNKQQICKLHIRCCWKLENTEKYPNGSCDHKLQKEVTHLAKHVATNKTCTWGLRTCSRMFADRQVY